MKATYDDKVFGGTRQKAPSAKRCIKTVSQVIVLDIVLPVRKHRAPKGALRPRRLGLSGYWVNMVRKHRAPKGALRPSFQ